MSAPQEYHYIAKPAMPHCQGTSCYCFAGKNQMDAEISDSDSDSQTSEAAPYGWRFEEEDEWCVSLNDFKFRHPRVLLAYFRFVSTTNELAKTPEEYIHLPLMPKKVKEGILNHISFKEPPAEFQEEINDLHSWVCLLS